jgi:hypothetical protein
MPTPALHNSRKVIKINGIKSYTTLGVSTYSFPTIEYDDGTVESIDLKTAAKICAVYNFRRIYEGFLYAPYDNLILESYISNDDVNNNVKDVWIHKEDDDSFIDTMVGLENGIKEFRMLPQAQPDCDGEGGGGGGGDGDGGGEGGEGDGEGGEGDDEEEQLDDNFSKLFKEMCNSRTSDNITHNRVESSDEIFDYVCSTDAFKELVLVSGGGLVDGVVSGDVVGSAVGSAVDGGEGNEDHGGLHVVMPPQPPS